MDDSARRSFLRRSGAVLGVALAGCLDRGGTRSQPTKSPTLTEPPSETPTETPSESSPTPSEEPVAWEFHSGGRIPTAPATAEGTVFVANEDGMLFALEVGSGQEEWRYRIDGQFMGVPLAHDGTVIAQSGTNSLGDGQPLHALDMATGEKRWGYFEQGWQEVLGVREDTLYVATSDDYLQSTGQKLHAVSMVDGTIRWSAEIGDPSGGLVTNDAVYVPSHGRLYAFDAKTGSQRWTADVPDYFFRTVAAVEDAICYVARGDDHRGVLYARDAATGEERWRFDDWFVSSTTSHDGTLYVGGEKIAAFDPTSGTPRWAADVRGFVPQAPVHDGTLYAGGDVARAIAISDGTVQWSWTPDVTVQGLVPAGVGHGAAYFDSFRDADPRNRFKFAVETDSGSNRWTFGPDTNLTDLTVGQNRVVVGGTNGIAYGLDS